MSLIHYVYRPGQDVILAIRRYKKLVDRFVAKPNASNSEANARRALDDLVVAIREDERLHNALSLSLDGGSASVDSISDPAFRATERRLVCDLALMSGSDVDRVLITAFKEADSAGISVDDFIGMLVKHHEFVVTEARNASAAERKESDKKKREIRFSIEQMIVGSVTIVANNYFLLLQPDWNKLSTSVGAGLVVGGLKDLRKA